MSWLPSTCAQPPALSQLLWRQQAGRAAQRAKARALREEGGAGQRETAARARTGSGAVAGQRVSATALRASHRQHFCSHAPGRSPTGCPAAVSVVCVSSCPLAAHFTVLHAGTTCSSLCASEIHIKALSHADTSCHTYTQQASVFLPTNGSTKRLLSVSVAVPLTGDAGNTGCT